MLKVLAIVTLTALGGCQSVLKDLQTCERHYDGTISGGTVAPAIFAGKGKIDCCPTGLIANADHTNCVPMSA